MWSGGPRRRVWRDAFHTEWRRSGMGPALESTLWRGAVARLRDLRASGTRRPGSSPNPGYPYTGPWCPESLISLGFYNLVRKVALLDRDPSWSLSRCRYRWDLRTVSVLPLLYVVDNRNYRRSASDVDLDRVKGIKFVRDNPARGMGGRVSAKVVAVGEGPLGRGLPGRFSRPSPDPGH